MSKEQRQADRLIKMYFKNLDNVYDACKAAADGWGVDHIPLKTLRAVIDIVKKGIEKGLADERSKG